jgi:imidazole glycerol-phosphate synthase subunit HisH
MSKILVIDYGSGNIESVLNAFHTFLPNENIKVLQKAEDLKSASHIVLPGVSAFADCMNGLNSIPNLITELKNQVLQKKKPFLGICVGMQVMASIGNEGGAKINGLDFISGEVIKITPNQGLKIPHMGWNNLNLQAKHKILQNIKDQDHVYFANSYHFICKDASNILANVEYGDCKINAVLAKENIIGIQFHPEKSGESGLQILQNFARF